MIDAPKYNFSVPSQLKAWDDRIAQTSEICRYTENGPVKLAEPQKSIIASSLNGKNIDNKRSTFCY